MDFSQAFDELEDLVDQGHLGRVAGRQEGVDGQQRVDEQDGVLAQVEVSAHSDHGQLKCTWNGLDKFRFEALKADQIKSEGTFEQNLQH